MPQDNFAADDSTRVSAMYQIKRLQRKTSFDATKPAIQASPSKTSNIFLTVSLRSDSTSDRRIKRYQLILGKKWAKRATQEGNKQKGKKGHPKSAEKQQDVGCSFCDLIAP
jgi:hypothetical protein